MRKLKPDRCHGQFSSLERAFSESLPRQASLSSFAFLEGLLVHWPTASVVDPFDHDVMPDPAADYSLLIEEARQYRRRLESIRPGKTPQQRQEIRACAIIQNLFSTVQ